MHIVCIYNWLFFSSSTNIENKAGAAGASEHGCPGPALQWEL